MFLDFDGDGVYTSYDKHWVESGVPVTIDVYVVTDRDDPWGSLATCPDGTAPDLSAYTVNLYSVLDAVSFISVTNQMPGMSEQIPLVTYPYALTVGYGGSQRFPPGKHHLLRITAEFSGCPGLSIVPASCYSPPGVVTSFESSCPGLRSDYVLRAGEDWLPAEGIYGCTDYPGRAPSIECPGAISGSEGQPLTFPVTLTDPDCEIFSFYIFGMPQGAAFTGLSAFQAGRASGAVSWTPSFGQAGTHSIVFNASDYPSQYAQRDECTTQVTISPSSAVPIAEAGGPYTGVEGVPLTFNGTGSHDPNGDPLQFSWSFGDGAVGAGSTPTHIYASGGTFTAVLAVADPGGLSDQDSAAVSVVHDYPALLFTAGGNETTRLPRGRPTTCFHIEPASGSSFTADEIVPSSVALRYDDPECGELIVYPEPMKSITIGDTDRNGVPEYEACFSRDAMATVALCLPAGTSSVPLEFYGSLVDGDQFHGQITHTIILGKGSLAASISPNPLSPNSALEFTTGSPGFVTVRLFDVRGRLVATLLDERSVPAGPHRMPLIGTDRALGRLAPGVYFVKVSTERDGTETRALTILKW